MKKIMIIIMILCLQQLAYADFENENVDYNFDRRSARQYMKNYWNNYNPAYFDFDKLGGDCTNYASQIMKSAGVPFTERVEFPDFRYWYYYDSDWGYNRTSTWTGATEFRKYFGDVVGVGEKTGKSMKTYTVNDAIVNFNDIWKNVLPGDIISHGHTIDTSYHNQIVYDFGVFRKDIKVSQHSSNELDRSLFDYLNYRKRIGQGNEFVFVITM